MAIRIHELGDVPGVGPVYPDEPLRTQTGVVGASSAVVTNGFLPDVQLVCVETDEDCHVVFGNSPTATTSGYKVLAGVPREFATSRGQKVAWIAA